VGGAAVLLALVIAVMGYFRHDASLIVAASVLAWAAGVRVARG
jgi:hypothetical protein